MKTEAEFVAEMKVINADRNEELAHIKADALVTEALRELGWHKLADAYDDDTVTRWYA